MIKEEPKKDDDIIKVLYSAVDNMFCDLYEGKGYPVWYGIPELRKNMMFVYEIWFYLRFFQTRP